MKLVSIALLFAALANAAIDGTVVNGTTGQPQPNATVTLYKVGGNGPEALQSVKSGPDGKFSITVESQGGGPRLVQAAYQGAVYNHMIPPGFPATGITINVYNSSTQANTAKVDQHMMLLEPDGQSLTVSESFVMRNDGKVTYNDPANGTLRFWLPTEAAGKAEVNVLAPGSVPVRRAPQKTSDPNVMKMDIPVLPGETRIDIAYQIPFTSPGDFSLKTFYKGNATKVVAPLGVTFTGDGLKKLGEEPRSQASIYGVDTPAFTVHVDGTGTLKREDANAGGGDSPSLMQVMPRLYEMGNPADGFGAAVLSVKWILLAVFGILAAGFVLLYRKTAE